MDPRHVRIARRAFPLSVLLLTGACALPTAPEVAEATDSELPPSEALVEVGVVFEFNCLYEDPPEEAADDAIAEPEPEPVGIHRHGPTTITGSQNPLIVVNGERTAHGLADISSLDVVSIELVKGHDPRAREMWGEEAEHGVVLITTGDPGTRRR